jgi:hypothetical protein
MDPLWWRTASYAVVFVGTALVLAGSVGTWYFGSLVEQVAPYRQPIRSASATVEVFIRSDEPEDDFFMDSGGYLAFSKGSQQLLTTASAQCLVKQMGGGRLLFRGVFEMDATDPAVGRPVSALRQAEFAEVTFEPMPPNAHVLEGRAVVTINSAVRFELAIPEQDAKNGLLFVRDLTSAFADFR